MRINSFKALTLELNRYKEVENSEEEKEKKKIAFTHPCTASSAVKILTGVQF